jgi:alkylation response protein AidB-like acyl-CoA dehydrogenase
MTNDLSTDGAWNEFLMKFTLGLTLPTTYGGSNTPTFESTVVKDGMVKLSAGAATCATCAVALAAPTATNVNV